MFVSTAPSNTRASELKDDEIIVFFNTTAYLDASAEFWSVPIHVWVNEPENSYFRAKMFAAFLELKYDLELNAESKPLFSRRTNLLIADNERGKDIVVQLAGKNYQLNRTHENGQSTTILKIPVADIPNIKDGDFIDFKALLNGGDNRQFAGKVKFIYPDGISVISDIDDTIKITQVTNHRLLFENTFLKPFRAVPGMASLYLGWSIQGVNVHFVSSSPWQLYPEINRFIVSEGFPWSSFSLKSVRFRDETIMNLFKKGIETKPKQIEPILRAYPKRRFVLIGDSGEEDPEVYAAMVKKHPKQIVRVYIRSVNNYIKDKKRMEKLFKDLLDSEQHMNGSYWQLFTFPGELSLPVLRGI